MNMNPATNSTLGVGPYRVITYSEKDGFSRKDFVTRAALVAYVVAEMGGELRGLSTPGRARPQLWNQPQFSNLCGPMWDGDAVRYESTGAYEVLSR